MNRDTIEKILNFLKEKEDKRLPINWKIFLAKENIIRKLENHPDGTLYIHHGYSDLRNTNIKRLPKDFYTDDSLTLSGCKQLTELPDKLHVGGSLYLNDSSITELPKKLFVGGSLDLNKTNITKLPDNLFVYGWLDLENCKQITELPKKLYVGGNLFIRNTSLVNKYTEKEIRDIVASTGGEIKKRIIMY